jgi:hypothetical protein
MMDKMGGRILAVALLALGYAAISIVTNLSLETDVIVGSLLVGALFALLTLRHFGSPKAVWQHLRAPLDR